MPPLPPSDRQVFVDTSAHFALAHRRDKNHPAAQDVLHFLTEQRWRLFTSNFIVAETHALTLARLGQEPAVEVLRRLRHGALNVIRVTPDHEDRAEEIIAGYHDKLFSFTDGTSFAIMEAYGIRYAFSFDSDFTQFGFVMLTSGFFR